MYRRLCQRETLRLGWLKVQTGRKESHGVDGISISMLKPRIEHELSELAYELETRKYQCKPLRRVYMAKANGGKRPLGIACIRDRIVQSACLILMEPVFDPNFSSYSFAFRPRRDAHQALALAKTMIAAEHTWAVIADIKKCFDSIDHDVLLRLVSQRIGDQDLLNLIRHWLTTDVLDFCELVPTAAGVPQGESLSPLLANIYLDPLDRHFEHLGLSFVRYADDMIILTSSRKEAEKALQIMENFLLDPLHLQLKPAKTNLASLDTGFEFLGFRMGRESVGIKKSKVDEVEGILRGCIRILGETSSTLEKRVASIMRINALIRGFRNYFALPDESRIEEQLRFLDEAADQMANYYLPLKIKNDPAWICRERFRPPRATEDAEHEQDALKKQAWTGNGYPEDGPLARPAQWMIKSSPVNHEEKRIPSPILEEEEPADINPSNTCIEYDDRLCVLTHGGYLTLMNQELVIRKRKVEIFRRPLEKLGLVFLQGLGMTISVTLQLRLAELDIPVIFAPPVGAPAAALTSVSSHKSFLRSRQITRRDDPDIIHTGLNMIASKVGNQAAVLRYFSKYRNRTNPELGRQLTEAADEISDVAESVRILDPSTASVRALAMGHEGWAASIYWRQIIGMLPKELGFSGRVTRSASDVVNQCFNYAYGMLYGEVWRVVVKAGLDPYFGLIHGSKRDQGSLVFDLIEEFRAPFADRLVIGMLGRGFQPTTGKHGLLTMRTRRHLALGFSKRWLKKIPWRSRKMTPAAILENQANSLAKLFGREGNYHPFKMRW